MLSNTDFSTTVHFQIKFVFSYELKSLCNFSADAGSNEIKDLENSSLKSLFTIFKNCSDKPIASKIKIPLNYLNTIILHLCTYLYFRCTDNNINEQQLELL